MPYCIYLRKSRADEEAELRGEEDTLARHERALLDLAKRQKRNITAIYKEVVSGETISARPQMQKLLSEIEQGCWEGVLVMEVERLARGDTIDQGIVAQAFKYSDTKIITPSKTYDPNNEFDEEFFEFGLFMSRREYKTINRRLQRGRLASVKEGKWVGNKPPYGYVRKKLEREKGYSLEPHSEQSDVVKLIFELYTQNKIGASLIANRLNDLKIPAYKGGPWVPSTILDILANPVYIGKIRWNSRPQVKKIVDGEITIERPRAEPEDIILADGLHEPLINLETWLMAQENLKVQNPLPISPKTNIKNPLAGLIVCSVCGRKMVRKPYKRDYPDTLMCPLTGCPNISSHLYLVEEKLLEALEEWLKEYKLDLDIANGDKSTTNVQLELINKSIKKLEDELKTYEGQMGNLHDLLERGIYSTETFLERSKILADRISSIEKHLSSLSTEFEKETTREKSKRTIIPKVERVLEVYNTTKDPAIKNDLLKEVLEKVVYTKTVNGRHGKLDDFNISLYPKMPE